MDGKDAESKALRKLNMKNNKEKESLQIQYRTLSSLDADPKSVLKINLLIHYKMDQILQRLNELNGK